MDRRALLAGLSSGLGLASIGATGPARAQANDIPNWGSPVIDMHFHMRPELESNIAHQIGAGITAANLLTNFDAEGTTLTEVRALQAKKPAMFPCWFGAYDIRDQYAETFLTKAAKSGAKGFGEFHYAHGQCDSPQVQRIYALAGEMGLPILLHFQEEDIPWLTLFEGSNMGFWRFEAMLKAYPKTKFIGHADAFWANVSADYNNKDPYPTGPIVRGGISDRLLSDYSNLHAGVDANSGNLIFSRDHQFSIDFLKRHQDKLMFGSDCPCDDGRGHGVKQNAVSVPERVRGKCVARENLKLLTSTTTPDIFHKIVWANAHKLLGMPA